MSEYDTFDKINASDFEKEYRYADELIESLKAKHEELTLDLDGDFVSVLDENGFLSEEVVAEITAKHEAICVLREKGLHPQPGGSMDVVLKTSTCPGQVSAVIVLWQRAFSLGLSIPDSDNWGAGDSSVEVEEFKRDIAEMLAGYGAVPRWIDNT
jgi:hypothetical protein